MPGDDTKQGIISLSYKNTHHILEEAQLHSTEKPLIWRACLLNTLMKHYNTLNNIIHYNMKVYWLKFISTLLATLLATVNL